MKTILLTLELHDHMPLSALHAQVRALANSIQGDLYFQAETNHYRIHQPRLPAVFVRHQRETFEFADAPAGEG